MIKVGVDIVKILVFEKRALRSGLFLGNIFTDKELEEGAGDYIRLAGWFAAKEAVIKALEFEAGQWKKIEIMHEDSGRPYVKSSLLKDTHDFDLSISKDGDYAMAVFIISQ